MLNLDRFEGYDPHPQKAKIDNDEMILSMLLPNQLKAPEMVFLEEEDIADENQLRASTSSALPKAPLTGF